MQEDTDIVASTKTAQKLVEDYNNPNLRIKIVSNTGHVPGAEMMELLLRGLDKVVVPSECNLLAK